MIFFCQYFRLWHLKNPDLPNAVSQSPTDCRFQRRKPADYPRILLCRILALLHKAVAKTGVSRRKTRNRQTIAKSAAFCSFVPLQRKTQCLRQNLVAKAAKTVMSTERSEWRHLETVAKVLQMRTKHYRNCE